MAISLEQAATTNHDRGTTTVAPGSAVADLPPAHVAHRQAFWDFVRDQAEPHHRDALTRLLTVWEDANTRHYGGALTPPIILLAEPIAPDVYGDCGPVSGWGARSQIRIRPSLLTGTHPHMQEGAAYAEGRFRFVADVLVHEQIHQWQQARSA
jgi:hypothetical protein